MKDIVENYQDAVEGIYHHIGYWNDWEFCTPEFTHVDDKWKWDGEKVSFYAEPFDEDQEITEEDFIGSLKTDYLYRGNEYTGIAIKTTYDDEIFLDDVRLQILKNDMEIENEDEQWE